MSLIVVDPYNNDIMDKLDAFRKCVSTNLSFIDEYKKISSNKSKEEYTYEINNSINISRILVNIKSDEIVDLCYIRGARDNKLIELYFESLSSKVSKAFINTSTDYAFNELDAETVTIFSNKINQKMLEEAGYESLGQIEGMTTYVKDRQEYQGLGTIKK